MEKQQQQVQSQPELFHKLLSTTAVRAKLVTINNNKYQLLHIIGDGRNCSVYKAKRLIKSEGKSYAIKKIIPSSGISQEKEKAYVRTEIEIMKKLKEKGVRGVVQIEEACETGGDFYIVMEYYPCNLAGKIQELRLKESWEILKQIANALRVLHTQLDIMHRDIKPENILLREDGTAVVADFGVSKHAMSAVQRQTTTGTDLYMAPEVIFGEPYSKNCDCFSLGVTFYYMVYKQMPFSQDPLMYYQQLKAFKDTPVNLPVVKQLHQKIVNQILAGLLTYDREKRMTMEELCKSINRYDIYFARMESHSMKSISSFISVTKIKKIASDTTKSSTEDGEIQSLTKLEDTSLEVGGLGKKFKMSKGPIKIIKSSRTSIAESSTSRLGSKQPL